MDQQHYLQEEEKFSLTNGKSPIEMDLDTIEKDMEIHEISMYHLMGMESILLH